MRVTNFIVDFPIDLSIVQVDNYFNNLVISVAKTSVFIVFFAIEEILRVSVVYQVFFAWHDVLDILINDSETYKISEMTDLDFEAVLFFDVVFSDYSSKAILVHNFISRKNKSPVIINTLFDPLYCHTECLRHLLLLLLLLQFFLLYFLFGTCNL